MASESSALLACNRTTGAHRLVGPRRGIAGQLWVVYLICFAIATLSTMTIAPKLRLQADMVCRAGASASATPPCPPEAVDSRVAWLATIQSITLGAFSALSTGYWSRRAERVGRAPVLAIILLGIGLDESIFILANRLRWPLMVLPLGSLAEGILGGPATLNTLITGYLHNRLTHHHLSTATGLLLAAGTAMVGAALGPSLGTWMTAISGAQLLAPSYATLACLPALALVTRFLVPHEPICVSRTHSSDLNAPRTGFLKPLHVLKPSASGDHSLLLLAISYGLYCFVAGFSTVKLQYAAFKFHWDTVQTGQYLTILGASRVVSLLLIIPGGLYLWSRKAMNSWVSMPVDGSIVEGQNGANQCRYGSVDEDCRRSLSPQATPPTLPFGCPSTNTSQSSLTLCPSEVDGDEGGPKWMASTTNQGLKVDRPCPSPMSQASHQTNTDFNLARLSIGWGVICGICLVCSRDMLGFVVPSALDALAGSTGPAIQAAALGLLAIKGRHLGSGDLISSFSLIRILMYELLGPLVSGTVYVHSHSQGSSKTFLVLIVGLELTNLTVINLVRISATGSPADDEERACGKPAPRP